MFCKQYFTIQISDLVSWSVSSVYMAVIASADTKTNKVEADAEPNKK
jgi:hypothetical protein